MAVVMMNIILTAMVTRMWRIISPAPRIVMDIDTPTTTSRMTSLPPAKAISRRTCSHSHGHGPVPPSASYESQLRPTDPIILIIATPHLPVRPFGGGRSDVFFAARSAGQSTPIFPTMTIFIWAANCAWLASSGVWDDCLEVGGRWCHGGGSVRTFAPKGSHLPIPM